MVVAHITSLPTEDKRPGHLGKPCYRFIDWLASQNQSWWQILPINPCDEYGSAYAGISAFAGNEQLIDGSSETIDEKEFKKFLEENGTGWSLFKCVEAGEMVFCGDSYNL